MNPFNLEKAIAAWRRCLLDRASWSSEVVDELESHLRDEIEQRTSCGDSDEEAFGAAVASIGDPDSLRAEFAKLSDKHRLGKVVAVALPATGLAVLVSNSWTFLDSDFPPAQRFIGLSVGLATALYLGTLPHYVNALRPAAYHRFAVAMKLSSGFVVLWPIYALLQALHTIPFELPLLVMTLLWCFYAAGALTIILMSLAHQRGTCGGSDASAGRVIPATPPPSGTPGMNPGDARNLMQVFHPSARNALIVAGKEASRLGHDFIGTEHVLLGILKSAPANVLEHLRTIDLKPERIIREIERSVKPVLAQDCRAKPPLTARVRRAFELALLEAEVRHQSTIGPEHILLGLLSEREGVAGRVLRKLGLRIGSLRGVFT